MALIINSFFEVGFKPYSVKDIENDAFIKNYRNDNILQQQRYSRNGNSQNQFFWSYDNVHNKLNNRQNYNFEYLTACSSQENQLNMKKILKKEHLLKLNRLVHYWDYISIIFGEQDMCRFANFKYEEAECCSQKAIGWIVLLLSNTKTISSVLHTIYSIDFIQQTLYDYEESYITSRRSDLFQIASLLELIDLKIEMKVINDFNQYQLEVYGNRYKFNSVIQIRENHNNEECNIEEIKENTCIECIISDINKQNDELECKEDDQTKSHFLIKTEECRDDSIDSKAVLTFNESGDNDKNSFNLENCQNGKECLFPQAHEEEFICSPLVFEEINGEDIAGNNDYFDSFEFKQKLNISRLKQEIKIGESIEVSNCLNSYKHYSNTKSNEKQIARHSRTHTLFSDSCFSERNLIEYLTKNQCQLENQHRSRKMIKYHSKHQLDLNLPVRPLRNSESRKKSLLLIDVDISSQCQTYRLSNFHIKYSNTDHLYFNELMEEIKNRVYSSVRRKVFITEKSKQFI